MQKKYKLFKLLGASALAMCTMAQVPASFSIVGFAGLARFLGTKSKVKGLVVPKLKNCKIDGYEIMEEQEFDTEYVNPLYFGMHIGWLFNLNNTFKIGPMVGLEFGNNKQNFTKLKDFTITEKLAFKLGLMLQVTSYVTIDAGFKFTYQEAAVAASSNAAQEKVNNLLEDMDKSRNFSYDEDTELRSFVNLPESGFRVNVQQFGGLGAVAYLHMLTGHHRLNEAAAAATNAANAAAAAAAAAAGTPAPTPAAAPALPNFQQNAPLAMSTLMQRGLEKADGGKTKISLLSLSSDETVSNWSIGGFAGVSACFPINDNFSILARLEVSSAGSSEFEFKTKKVQEYEYTLRAPSKIELPIPNGQAAIDLVNAFTNAFSGPNWTPVINQATAPDWQIIDQHAIQPALAGLQAVQNSYGSSLTLVDSDPSEMVQTVRYSAPIVMSICIGFKLEF